MTVEAINLMRLHELFALRESYPRRGYDRGYVNGLIDEFCAQNAIDEQELADAYAEWVAGRSA